MSMAFVDIYFLSFVVLIAPALCTVYNCDASNPCDNTINCTPNENCTVLCNGESVCESMYVQCPYGNYNCIISCIGLNTCRYAIVDASPEC